MPKGIPKNRINKGWFKKGYIPWNKGKKTGLFSNKEYYQKHKEREKKRNREYYYLHKERCLKRKRKNYDKIRILKKEFGGKCVLCGYLKNFAALQFHHKKGKKRFSVSSRNCSKSISKLRKEAKKCILVCANCHYEIHHPV